MDLVDKRRRVADDVFSATGVKMDWDDPLVTAALFYSHQMREAGDSTADQLRQATAELKAATKAAASVNISQSAARTRTMKEIEAHISKCVKLASKGQCSSQSFRYIPIWYAVGSAVAVAVAFSAALMFGIERGSALAEEAAVGRSFKRVVPTMDPKLRAQLMEHLRKNPG
jgi:hypothetical protein